MFDKKSVEKNQWMIDPDDAVMLLIDHQRWTIPTGQRHRSTDSSRSPLRAREDVLSCQDANLHHSVGS